MEELVYKIRHKRTGMFFKSARINVSHLSKKGRMYLKKPSDKQMSDWLCCKVDNGFSKPNDWELVTYKTQEI